MITLGELADRLGLAFSGDAARELRSIAPLGAAKGDQVAFISNKKYLSQLAETRAGAVIVKPEWQDDCPVDCLLSEHPYVSFARTTQVFDDRPVPDSGVHATALIADEAQLGEGVSIGPGACIEPGVVLGEGVIIGAGVYIGHDTQIGDRTRVYPNAVIYHGVSIGSDCTIHSQTVIGADGFGFAPGPQGWEKICQLGAVLIGDRVDIGASCTIDRGALEDTVIADGVIIDDQVHVAHNCRIGKNTAIAGCTGIAGSTTIGENCTLAGAVGVSGHLEICDNVHLTGQTRVTKSITEPGSYSSGTPMAETREWGRNAVRFTQLDTLHKRIAALEKALNNKNG